MKLDEPPQAAMEEATAALLHLAFIEIRFLTAPLCEGQSAQALVRRHERANAIADICHELPGLATRTTVAVGCRLPLLEAAALGTLCPARTQLLLASDGAELSVAEARARPGKHGAGRSTASASRSAVWPAPDGRRLRVLRPRPLVGYRDPMRRDVTRTFAELTAAHLTYQEVGATRAESLPRGYGHVHRDVSLGTGPEVFERAVAALFDWRMHQEAGLAVISSGGNPAPGIVVVLRAGWGPLHFTIPCRVVYTVDEADRRGFAYGTLPGHPERGEEAFMVVKTNTGDVRIRIRAFSRPASLVARAGGPLSRMLQQYATNRYVSAIRRLARTKTDPRKTTP